MRTKPAGIEPGCPYCNYDHNPDITCRFMPVSIRGQLPPKKPVQPVRPIVTKDITGKIIAVKLV